MVDIIISFGISTESVCSVFNGERFTYRRDDVKRYKTIGEAQKDIVKQELKKRLRKGYRKYFSYELAICRGKFDNNGELIEGKVLKRCNYGC